MVAPFEMALTEPAAGWSQSADRATGRTAVRTLADIDSPSDLRKLPATALPQLARELREFLIASVASTGGHLSANLGTVELTLALHYVYDTPRDTLVWDVGHQAYAHKVLTGRRDEMGTIRRRGGLSGFLRRDESRHDSFGAGHSSTSVSAATGMAIANALNGRAAHAVAIIGDGALTAGLAFEALNHAGAQRADVLVILNDNGMSISPNVGALSQSFARREAAASFFGALGFDYEGPVDGHDLTALLRALREQRRRHGPRLLHVRTVKGHGYAPAAAAPVRYHGVTPFEPAAGMPAAKPAAVPTYTDVFGEWLSAAAERDSRVVAVTPAMIEGSGLSTYARRFPDRCFDVGIAEQHSVTFAAGLATSGARPVVAIYSTFMQRAFDQVVHDVALQRLPVLFAIDRAGLVGPDGATHNGSLDLAFLRCIPGMVVMTPSDGTELAAMLTTGLACDGPAAVRYPRTAIPQSSAQALRQHPIGEIPAVPLGRAVVRRQGEGVALLAFGPLLQSALAVGEQLNATVVDMRFVKPLDTALVLRIAATHKLLVTIEEGAVAGGAGAAVAECLAGVAVNTPLMMLGLPDRPLEHGTRDEVLRDAGLDTASLLAAVEARLRAADN
jgi:1-deoxy-D-xylulose-5-phosphate synthase